jgi:ankyrin repeat protein
MRARAGPYALVRDLEKAVRVSAQNDHANTIAALLRSTSRAFLAYLATAGFRVAARYGSTGALRVLLDAHADVNRCVHNAWSSTTTTTPLCEACNHGHADTAAVLLEFKACVDLGEPSPLALAVRGGQYDVVKVLLRFKAAADGRVEANGTTALQLAAQCGRAAVVQVLLDGNADVNFTEHAYMEAPLAKAASRGHDEAVRVLLKGKAAVNRCCEAGGTALHLAAGNYQETNLRVVHLLLEAGADVNAADLDGETPLMCASRAESCPTVHILLESKADATRTDSASRTALDHAYYGPQGDLQDPDLTQLVSMLSMLMHARNASHVPSTAT